MDNLLGARHQEGLKLAQKLSERQLQIKEIASDGHCLYRAIEDQLARRALVRILEAVSSVANDSYALKTIYYL